MPAGWLAAGRSKVMGLQPRKLVAPADVADVDRSIAFYESHQGA
jgi:hypothetical protein